jgi:hypothetical protein
MTFVLGWSDNCEEFRFGHIQSVTVLQYMVSKIAITQPFAPPPPPHQQYSFIYTIQFFYYYLEIQWCFTAL